MWENADQKSPNANKFYSVFNTGSTQKPVKYLRWSFYEDIQRLYLFLQKTILFAQQCSEYAFVTRVDC